MRLHISRLTRLFQHVTQPATDGMRKRNMSHNSFAKERRFFHTCPRPIEKLIGNHHVQRRVLLLQGTDSRRRENAFNAQQLHRVDVSAKRNLSRNQTVTASMTRKKCNSFTFERSDDE